MGVDIHTQIFAKTETGWEELKVYAMVNGKMEDRTSYAPYNDRNYDLFDVLEGLDCRGMWEDMPQESKEYHLYEGQYWTYKHSWFDWCELVALAKTDEALDYKGENLLAPWIDQMRFVLEVYGLWYVKPGEVMVCIAFDR